MDTKKEIVICLGSSCFARGNKATVKQINNYLTENNLMDQVYFHGNHCFGKCDKGPFVKIEDVLHEKVGSDNIVSTLDATFKKKQ